MPASSTALLCATDGSVTPLRIDRWIAAVPDEEMALLARALAPVIDVGCGPGRHVYELAARGVLALGIDCSPDAVASARRRGSTVLHRSVFDRIPNEGHWRTALLMDGNIGIGGDAIALLTRLHQLLVPGGSALVEVEPPGANTIVETVRVERDGVAGPWFPWARVGLDGVDHIAQDAGFSRAWTHEEDGRWFVELTS